MKESDDAKKQRIEEIAYKIANTLRILQKQHNEEIKTCIRRIENAKTIKEIMEHKKILQRRWIDQFPMNDNTCPYCLLDGDCGSCEYAKYHAICGDHGSDWTCLVNAFRAMQVAIERM